MQIGIVKSIEGSGRVTATSADGQTRELKQGDAVYLGEILNTSAQVQLVLVDNQGQELLTLGENNQVLVDESVTTQLAEGDTVLNEVEALQAQLEQGEEIPDEETAAGEEDPFAGDPLGFHEGDRSAGDVDPRLLGIESNDGAPPLEDGPVNTVDTLPPPEEPFPLFIVGSNPPEGQDGADIYTNDIPGSLTPHTVPGVVTAGQIAGQSGDDALVGDPGGTKSALEQDSVNFIISLDVSHSMEGNMSTVNTKISDMIFEAKDQVLQN
ncbi:MAG: retention module-containing protein, partial [Desulfobacterales bacterium]|nr:retention module-containing protein [Desulfobacterales bacterium]